MLNSTFNAVVYELPFPIKWGFPCGSAGKESACNAGDLGLIPGLGRSPGEGKDYPLQYSGLGKGLSQRTTGPLAILCATVPRNLVDVQLPVGSLNGA